MTIEPYFFLGFALGILVIAFGLGVKSFFRVEQGYLAVLTSFGKAVHDENVKKLKTFGPGLHLKLPWHKVIHTPMMEQSLDLSGETQGIVAMAEDGTILRLDSKLRFTPALEDLSHYLFSLRQPIEHIKGLFTCLLRNEIANFRGNSDGGTNGKEISERWDGSYSLIRRERKLLNKKIQNFAHNEIESRYGVRFNAIDLTDILPPDELADALNAVIHAQMEAHANYARAEGDCQQRVLSSEQGIAIERARAQAVETEILTLGRFLEDMDRTGTLSSYIDRRRTEVYSDSNKVFVRRSS